MTKEDQSRFKKISSIVADHFDCPIGDIIDRSKVTAEDHYKRKVLYLIYFKLLDESYKRINEYHYNKEDKNSECNIKYHLSNAKDQIVYDRAFKKDFAILTAKIKEQDHQISMEFGWDNEGLKLIKDLQESYHNMDKKKFIKDIMDFIAII
tara:strand:+ start:738 stop:1190 length:453 start_codon:yes stop_codon:yes gene_type:complete